MCLIRDAPSRERDAARERGVEGLMLKSFAPHWRQYASAARGEVMIDPYTFDAVMLYAHPATVMPNSTPLYTFAVWRDGGPVGAGRQGPLRPSPTPRSRSSTAGSVRTPPSDWPGARSSRRRCSNSPTRASPPRRATSPASLRFPRIHAGATTSRRARRHAGWAARGAGIDAVVLAEHGVTRRKVQRRGGTRRSAAAPGRGGPGLRDAAGPARLRRRYAGSTRSVASRSCSSARPGAPGSTASPA